MEINKNKNPKGELKTTETGYVVPVESLQRTHAIREALSGGIDCTLNIDMPERHIKQAYK